MRMTSNSAAPARVLGITAFVFILLFPLPQVFQGIDFSDMGYLVTGYWFFFSDPDSVIANLVIWYTNLAGALWSTCFGSLGLVAFKFGHAVLVWATAAICYIGLRDRERIRARLLVVLACTVAYVCGKAVAHWFSYDDLSALLYTMGALLLFHGVTRARHAFIFASGFVLASNIGVRPPSLLGLWLASAIVLHAWLKGAGGSDVVRQGVAFCAGVVAAVVIAAGLFVMLGHHRLDWAYFGVLNERIEDMPRLMWKLFILAHWKALLQGAVTCALFLAVGAGLQQPGFKRLRGVFPGVFFVATLLNALYAAPYDFTYHAVVGVLYISLAYLFVSRVGHDADAAVLYWLAFFQLLLAPLGSMDATHKMSYGMWLAIPVVILGLADGQRREPRVLGAEACRAMACLLAAVLTAVGIAQLWSRSYRDSTQRLTMTASVDHPAMRGLLTTPRRARVIQEFLDAAPRYIRPGQRLLTVGSIPAVHFLTKTRPYLGMPWPDLMATETVHNALRTRKQAIPEAPVLVFARQSAQNDLWPVTEPRAKEAPPFIRYADIFAFKRVWQGEFFAIYHPVADAPGN